MALETHISIRNLQQFNTGKLHDRNLIDKFTSTPPDKINPSISIPPDVPYIFSPGKISILNNKTEKDPEWISFDWPENKALPMGFEMGKVYVRDENDIEYVRTNIYNNGEWGWTNMMDINKEKKAKDRSVGSTRWYYKNYFPESDEHSIGYNQSLNEVGFTILNYLQDENIEIPKMLFSLPVPLPQQIEEGKVINHEFVYDPNRAEIKIIHYQDALKPENIAKNLEKKGWKYITSKDDFSYYVKVKK